MESKVKLFRITTIPLSLEKLLENQLEFINQFFDVKAISSQNKALKLYGRNNKIKVHYLELTRKITPLKDLKAVLKLYKLLIKEKPVIVHTHTPKAGIVGMLASYLAGVPYRIHTVAGLPLLEASGLKRKLLNIIEKLTYRLATKVYPNSFGLKEIILMHNFTKEYKLKVIGNGSSNGINTSNFNPDLFTIKDKNYLKNKLGIKKTDFVFIYVGRIVSHKGINELVEAFNKICLEEENAKLLLVGEFEDDLDPLQNSTKLSIDNNEKIISVGYQNDVRPYFAISDCLVFPSYREGFPNVVLQAGAMGLPSIVSDINGCNEIIIEGENGLIIPVKNVEAIITAMTKMRFNKTLYNRLKKNARALISSRYEQKMLWNALLEEYNLMLCDTHEKPK